MEKQLIVLADMEGATGIFDENYKEMVHGTEEWRRYGREKLTSDILAVCDAANEWGIDEILLYDGHYAGDPEHNVIVEKLPSNVKIFDTPNRCFFWRRIRGQAAWNPFGVITVGQHARYGEENAYFPHTIQSPPIKELIINGLNVAEIGIDVINFQGTKYIANIGCEASMKEAKELSSKVTTIAVKDKKKNWRPTIDETYKLIKSGVFDVLNDIDNKEEVSIEGPCKLSMTLLDEYKFKVPENISWKGSFEEKTAYWEAPTAEIGFEIFDLIREYIKE